MFCTCNTIGCWRIRSRTPVGGGGVGTRKEGCPCGVSVYAEEWAGGVWYEKLCPCAVLAYEEESACGVYEGGVAV